MKSLLIASLAALGLLTCACTKQGDYTATVTVTGHHATVSASPVQSSASATGSTGSGTPGSGAAGSSGSGSSAAGSSGSGPASSGSQANSQNTDPVIPACSTRYLGYKIGPEQGTTSVTYVVIDFHNLLNSACSLYGYPGVSQAAGKPVTQVGLAATENPATPRRLVTLPPYGYANALLTIAHAASYAASACHPVNAPWLVVYPPNQTVPLYVYYSSTACAKPVNLLTIDAVRHGTGG
ncbi:MAG TPA: DUF4232 domain-containing protein [Streptosporangiaceae bacterium]|nr:DUF4232 domain-containing protein [Streptosporangiaceae bacterium]